MATEMTTEISLRIAEVETQRVEQEKALGIDAARREALRVLNELLVLEQVALQRFPYGRGHAWNEWAIQVAIENLTREARDVATTRRRQWRLFGGPLPCEAARRAGGRCRPDK